MSKSSTTSLTGQPRLSNEIQPGYKNGRKIEQKRLKPRNAATKMAPRKECHTNRLCYFVIVSNYIVIYRCTLYNQLMNSELTS